MKSLFKEIVRVTSHSQHEYNSFVYFRPVRGRSEDAAYGPRTPWDHSDWSPNSMASFTTRSDGPFGRRYQSASYSSEYSAGCFMPILSSRHRGSSVHSRRFIRPSRLVVAWLIRPPMVQRFFRPSQFRGSSVHGATTRDQLSAFSTSAFLFLWSCFTSSRSSAVRLFHSSSV
jgi:hypothetical protein